MAEQQPLANIPTNIITGFLGVGKTTAIEYLLRSKPAHEKWAVLVNEFGEVGIDASLVAGKHDQQQGVYLREVPGGCMCCASGLPMQIALNMLLQTAQPDRLLIEPTGLGHPKEVLAVLSNGYYRNVLKLQATLTLVDARKLADTRYTENETFAQQIAIADILIANKADLYQADDHERLRQLSQNNPQLPVHTVEHGQLDVEWLQSGSRYNRVETADEEPTARAVVATSFAPQLPACGYLRIDNRGQGFNSSGWLFDADFVFDNQALYHLLTGIDAVRLKAVFITNDGVFGYNQVDGVLSCVELDDALDSRIEIIISDNAALDDLQDDLLSCVTQAPIT